ncbi:ATP-dependent nuclease [Pseudomonas japonica]|uniref:ATP-dependent nuclease n=1 Tax=Pseudomonas japonica TaxID=256466 RepID=UPI00380F5931
MPAEWRSAGELQSQVHPPRETEHEFNQGKALSMKVSRIWYSGIRTLNTPGKHQPMSASAEYHIDAMCRRSPLEPGDVNILLGENGTGKSTLLDMIRALRHPDVLASLPRENPPKQSFPAYRIEFACGEQWTYLFGPSALDDHREAFDHAGCLMIHAQPYGNGSRLVVRRAELFKCRPASPYPRLPTCDMIFYRNGSHVDDTLDERFVFELNQIRHYLRGVALRTTDAMGHTLLDNSSFQVGEEGLVNFWQRGDLLMSNRLQGDWLPSGWKSFAWTCAWLRRCPRHSICLIEEPETHLHPTLMRQMLTYLMAIAKNRAQQLFISTHSAALINIAARDELKIFQSYGTHIECKPALGATLDRMGYMASDIIQANCVIWVEGPSDRLYLNHWIKGMAPQLLEGTHYSIMFYGGRLLRHLAAEDEDTEDDINDLINLAGLNRHSAILLDSDKRSARAGINGTKERIVAAFSRSRDNFVWVTEGREIENYLDMDLLENAIRYIYKSAVRFAPRSQWSNLLQYYKYRAKKSTSANKVRVAAHYVENHPANYDILDLRQRMTGLCNFIRQWNAGVVR